MIDYVSSALEDPLFLRVVMGLWAAPLLGLGVFVLLDVSQVAPHYWLLLFPTLAGLLGLWLLHTAVLADDVTVEKRSDWLSEGGDWIGLAFVLVVLIVAIPIWELLKLRVSR